MLDRLRRRRAGADANDAGTLADEVMERAAGLRPAPAGVVLAGVAKPPHIAATMIHLAIRGHLVITEEGEAADPDWLLTQPPHQRAISGPDLAGFEKTLLHGIFQRRPARRLSELRHVYSAQQAISTASRQLLHQAVFSETLSPRDPADPPGPHNSGPASAGDTQNTLSKVRAFRGYLAALQPGDIRQQEAFSAHLPYAVALGFGEKWATAAATPEYAPGSYPWYRQLPALTTALTVYAGSVMPTGRHLGDDEPYGPSAPPDSQPPESPFRGYQNPL